MLSHPKWYTDSMQYLLKFQRHFFFQKQEDILNYVSNFKVPQRTKTILKTRNKFGGDHSSLFQNMLQNYSKQKRAVLTLRQKYKPREQKGWPRNHGVRGYMGFDKGVKITWWRKNCFFNKECWDNWISTRKELCTIILHCLKNQFQFCQMKKFWREICSRTTQT